jgi:hypothetical protein
MKATKADFDATMALHPHRRGRTRDHAHANRALCAAGGGVIVRESRSSDQSADVRFIARNGLKSDMAPCPKTFTQTDSCTAAKQDR